MKFIINWLSYKQTLNWPFRDILCTVCTLHVHVANCYISVSCLKSCILCFIRLIFTRSNKSAIG